MQGSVKEGGEDGFVGFVARGEGEECEFQFCGCHPGVTEGLGVDVVPG